MILHALLFSFLIIYESKAQEKCTTPKNMIGTCIDIQNCQPVISVIRDQKSLSMEVVDYLNSIHCGFENKSRPKVCCYENEIQTTTKETPTLLTMIPDPPDVTNHPNLPLLNHDVCGPITQPKIYGGNKTGIFDFPWMALLFYDIGNSVPEFRCGGSLISKRYVLTAAHCVTSLPNNFKLIGVRLGEHDLSTERDCDKEADNLEVVCAERYQDFGVENVHFHPEYSRGKLRNDIALLRLDGDADFRPQSVRPICLPIGTAAILKQKKVIVTGWGATELGPRSQDLLQVQLLPVSLEKCADVYKQKTQIWYKQICAGGTKGMDSCSGDSGGPLQAPGTYNNNLKYIQYGLVSFGPHSCGTEGAPGVYTKIAYYMDWILNTIRV